MTGEQREHEGLWDLRLFVSDHTPRSAAAFTNLKRMCDEHLAGNYRIEVIDVFEHPQCAREEQIVAIPTVERRSPAAHAQGRRRFIQYREDLARPANGKGLGLRSWVLGLHTSPKPQAPSPKT